MKLLRIIVVFILLSVVLTVSYQYWSQHQAKPQSKVETSLEESSSELKDLVVSPQTPRGSVYIDSATLSKDGFLVVRQMDDGKLSQVVEISKPLKKGTHNNVTVPLGSAVVSSSELIVMIYEDYANDGFFNDLDMPILDEDGFMTARYVKTGKPLPPSISEGDSAGSMEHNMPGKKEMAKVRYTDQGFIPDKIEVPVNSMVEFTNESSTVMWVASTPHPQHTDLPTFDQFKPVKKGAIYRYVFDKKGLWGFHDHINPSRGGVVTVK